MSPFIAQDHALLGKHFEVTALPWRRLGDAAAMRRTLRRHDVVFSWFLSHHSAVAALLARAMGKRSVAVLGGVEPARAEDTGTRLGWKDRWATRTAYNASDLVLAVSRFSLREGRALARPGRRSEVRHVPNGVDTDRFTPAGPKEDLVLTVGIVDPPSVHRKRLALFLEAAAKVPEARFVLAGPLRDPAAAAELRRAAPKHAELTGEVSDAELLALYRRAKVYVQASRHESFGMANAEAMACGAVPVVADRGALPEVVGDAGFVVPEPLTAEALARAVRRALASDLGPRARQRILDHHALPRREAALVQAIQDAAAGRLRRGQEVDP